MTGLTAHISLIHKVSFFLQVVNRRRVVHNDGELVAEHYHDEKTEQQGQKDREARDHDWERTRKQAAVSVHAVERVHDNQHKSMARPQKHVDEELQEELLVVEADAIVDPRAVVVHARYAAATSAAVVRGRRLDAVAFTASLAQDSVQEFDVSILHGYVCFHKLLDRRNFRVLRIQTFKLGDKVLHCVQLQLGWTFFEKLAFFYQFESFCIFSVSLGFFKFLEIRK